MEPSLCYSSPKIMAYRVGEDQCRAFLLVIGLHEDCDPSLDTWMRICRIKAQSDFLRQCQSNDWSASRFLTREPTCILYHPNHPAGTSLQYIWVTSSTTQWARQTAMHNLWKEVRPMIPTRVFGFNLSIRRTRQALRLQALSVGSQYIAFSIDI